MSTWVLVAVGCFTAGYVWGKAEKAVLAFVFDREEAPMRFVRRFVGHQTTVSTWAVVVSLVLSMVVGGYVVSQKREDVARTNCSIEFNKLSAQARDDRLAAQNAALQAQIESVQQDIDYQHGLRDSLTAGHFTLGRLLHVLHDNVTADRHLLHTLEHQQTVAAAHAFPPPDFCETR